MHIKMMYIHQIINECNNYIKIHFTNNFLWIDNFSFPKSYPSLEWFPYDFESSIDVPRFSLGKVLQLMVGC